MKKYKIIIIVETIIIYRIYWEDLNFRSHLEDVV